MPIWKLSISKGLFSSLPDPHLYPMDSPSSIFLWHPLGFRRPGRGFR